MDPQCPNIAPGSQRAILRRALEVGAVCGHSARTDLCGSPGETRGPTVTASPRHGPVVLHGPEVHLHVQSIGETLFATRPWHPAICRSDRTGQFNPVFLFHTCPFRDHETQGARLDSYIAYRKYSGTCRTILVPDARSSIHYRRNAIRSAPTSRSAYARQLQLRRQTVSAAGASILCDAARAHVAGVNRMASGRRSLHENRGAPPEVDG